VRPQGYAYDVESFAFAAVAELTVIGAGTGQTVIGPVTANWETPSYSPKGMVWNIGETLAIEAVTFRNCYEGLHVPQGRILLSDCNFDGNAIGILWNATLDGGSIQSSEFFSSTFHPYSIFILGDANGIAIRDVLSRDSELVVQQIMGVVLDDCSFTGRRAVFHAEFGSEVLLRNCSFDTQGAPALIVERDSRVALEGCRIVEESAPMLVEKGNLSASDSEVIGGSFSSVYGIDPIGIQITQSHILKGSGYAVYCPGNRTGGPAIFDFTGNYWGTSAADSIAAWIIDSADDPANNQITIDFEPFSGQQVSTEPMSWGHLKSLFR
jgi:hypothetical protein